MTSHGARERLENSCDLALLFDLQRAHAVVRFEDGERLDEKRLSTRAGIVDDARQRSRELSFDWNHKPPVADRDESLLYCFRIFRRGQDRGCAIARVGLRLREASPYAPQGRRSAIEHAGAFVDRVNDRAPELAQRRIAAKHAREIRIPVDGAMSRRSGSDCVADRAEVCGTQRVTDRRRLGERGGFNCRHNSKIRAGHQQAHRIGPKLFAANVFEVGKRRKVARVGSPTLRPRRRNDRVAHGGKVECLERSVVSQAHPRTRPLRKIVSRAPARSRVPDRPSRGRLS